MSEHTIELTRRKLLAGAGVLGAAGAGAGMGTSALFGDEESYAGNEIRAGELNLVVDYETSVSQDGVDTGSTTGGSTAVGGPATIDGNPATGEYVIKDLKPGDSGQLLFCPKIVDNPGWLWIGSADGLAGYENGQTEPEAQVDDTGGDPGAGNGELAESIEVSVSYVDAPSPGERRELRNPEEYTLGDLFKELETGFLIDGEPFSSGSSGTQAYPASPNDDTQTGPCLLIDWVVPASVGNEIQSDSVEFDLTFAAVQARNNDAPRNPFADVTVAPGESIASAVADAAAGDVVSVHGGVGGGVSVAEQVVIDKSLSLARAGAARPTIDGAGSSPAVSIEADGVTLDGFAVTNPDELLGIKVDPGHDDVTICNNRVHDVGPTGSLGVTGILVGQGDHDGVRIVGNVIEDLFQTDDGSFATLNGILFDADNSDPATITDVLVARNTIRNLESTTAPLGVVVQHDAENLGIEDNVVSDLLADNSLGAGSFTTFAQGISIDSQSTDDFEIVGNTLQNVVSADGFFGEAIKIEPTADVGGISVRSNELLSAIGINNANGANPALEAAGNYWGAASGPFEILANDDDGDVPTGSGPVDLDTVTESAVTTNVDYGPVASGPL